MSDAGKKTGATPHIEPEGPVAPDLLMPGDPLRARYIAERFLDAPMLFNHVRGMFGYTGTWKSRPISVMGSGMGIPSMGIYSFELFSYFGVERILRLGTCGGFGKDMELGDIVLAQASSTNSAWASQYSLGGTFSAVPDFGMLEAAVGAARRLGRRFTVGNTLCLDQYSKYHKDPGILKPWLELGIVATEMESFSLYCNAAALGKRALAMFTVGGLRSKGTFLSAEEKERSLDSMIEVALDSLLEAER